MTVYTVIKERNVCDKKMELAKFGDIYYIKVRNNKSLIIWARVYPTLRLANAAWRKIYNCINYGIDLEEGIE